MEKSCRFSRSPSIWMFLRTQLKSTSKWQLLVLHSHRERPGPSLTDQGASYRLSAAPTVLVMGERAPAWPGSTNQAASSPRLRPCQVAMPAALGPLGSEPVRARA